MGGHIGEKGVKVGTVFLGQVGLFHFAGGDGQQQQADPGVKQPVVAAQFTQPALLFPGKDALQKLGGTVKPGAGAAVFDPGLHKHLDKQGAEPDLLQLLFVGAEEALVPDGVGGQAVLSADVRNHPQKGLAVQVPHSQEGLVHALVPGSLEGWQAARRNMPLQLPIPAPGKGAAFPLAQKEPEPVRGARK